MWLLTVSEEFVNNLAMRCRSICPWGYTFKGDTEEAFRCTDIREAQPVCTSCVADDGTMRLNLSGQVEQEAWCHEWDVHNNSPKFIWWCGIFFLVKFSVYFYIYLYKLEATYEPHILCQLHSTRSRYAICFWIVYILLPASQNKCHWFN